MMQSLHAYQLLLSLTLTLAKKDTRELELPLCPQHLQFLPQELPMHCRLPRNVDPKDGPFPFFQNGGKPPLPFPMPQFPGIPGMLPGMPPGLPPGMSPGMPPGGPNGMPPGMPQAVPQGSPDSPPGIPKSLPMPMPMPMPIPLPGSPPHKMPVIVMPFYSQDRQSFKKPHGKHSSKKKSRKKRPHHHDSSDSDSDDDSDDTSDSDSSRELGWWKPPKKGKGSKKYGIYRRFNNRHHNLHNIRKKKKKLDLLTPILQYVTKDGYVIFEKKITKNEANNWLDPKDRAKAKEEINFKKALEVDLKEGASLKPEPEEEEFAPEEIKKPKEKNEKSEEVKEVNEVDETEELKTEKPPIRHKLKRFGSLLGGPLH